MHHNLIIKDGDTTKVVKEVLVDGIQFVDEKPRAGSTNPVTSDGVNKAIGDTKESVDEDVHDLQERIDEIAEKAGSGYIPKGDADVSTINALTGQENGWLYTLTDDGTLTDGSIAVVAGDTVAWDDANSVWYKAMNYAPAQYGMDQVKNLPTTTTAFRTGDVIPVDGPSGTAKMSKDDLLSVISQNDVVVNGILNPIIAPKFNYQYGYIPGQMVMYENELYVFKTEHAAATPWDASEVEKRLAWPFLNSGKSGFGKVSGGHSGTGNTHGGSFNGRYYKFNFVKGGSTGYVYLTARTEYKLNEFKNGIVVTLYNLSASDANNVDVMITTSTDWSSTIVSKNGNTIKAGETISLFFSYDETHRDQADTLNVLVRMSTNDVTFSGQMLCAVKEASDDAIDFVQHSAFSELSADAKDVQTIFRCPNVTHQTLNGGTNVRDGKFYKFTPSTTNYSLASYKINDYVENNKKMVLLFRCENYEEGKNYINRLLVSTNSGSWTSVKEFFGGRNNYFKSKEWKAYILDFSDITYVEGTNYFLMLGKDGINYTSSATLTFSFWEYSRSINLVGTCLLEEFNDVKAKREYITFWGDSLTALGGWPGLIGTLSSMQTYNCGVGGENSKCIMARQGGDAMMLFTNNDPNIVIPATTDAVEIRTNNIKTLFGNYVTPLLQGGGNVNPVTLDGIKGTLSLSSSKYYFTRSEAGTAHTIDRDARIVTHGDEKYNSPYLMVIFMGQNGGWSDVGELIDQHKKMIAHAKAKHVLVLGLSSGTADSRADYEAAMKAEFGRYFVSIRQYLAHPIYDSDNNIVSCYGIADEGLTPTADDLAKIAIGQVPSQLLADSVHYTDATKTAIGNMLYKYCQDLGIF